VSFGRLFTPAIRAISLRDACAIRNEVLHGQRLGRRAVWAIEGGVEAFGNLRSDHFLDGSNEVNKKPPKGEGLSPVRSTMQPKWNDCSRTRSVSPLRSAECLQRVQKLWGPRQRSGTLVVLREPIEVPHDPS
jgi:hypothetical protein